MLLNAPSATLQTLRSDWPTNAAIATQVHYIVAFVATYRFPLVSIYNRYSKP